MKITNHKECSRVRSVEALLYARSSTEFKLKSKNAILYLCREVSIRSAAELSGETTPVTSTRPCSFHLGPLHDRY